MKEQEVGGTVFGGVSSLLETETEKWINFLIFFSLITKQKRKREREGEERGTQGDEERRGKGTQKSGKARGRKGAKEGECKRL